MYRKAVSGARPAELVLDLGKDVFLWDLSPDGTTALISMVGEKTEGDLYAVALDGSTEPRLLRQSDAEDGAGRFSPDGKWISYWSQETGSGQVYLSPWPDMEYSRRVSTVSGAWASWTADSRELFFQNGDAEIFSVTIEPMPGGDVRIGGPELRMNHNGMQYEGPLMDVTDDGQRILAVMTIEATPPTFADLIIDWPDLLPRQ